MQRQNSLVLININCTVQTHAVNITLLGKQTDALENFLFESIWFHQQICITLKEELHTHSTLDQNHMNPNSPAGVEFTELPCASRTGLCSLDERMHDKSQSRQSSLNMFHLIIQCLSCAGFPAPNRWVLLTGRQTAGTLRAYSHSADTVK